MKKYIITSEPIEQFDFKGKSLGFSEKSAIFYCSSVGRCRYYKNSLISPNKGLKILSFKSKKYAMKICNIINEISYGDYNVECID